MALRDLILRPGEVVLPRAPKIKKPAKVPTHRQVRAQRAKELLATIEKGPAVLDDPRQYNPDPHA